MYIARSYSCVRRAFSARAVFQIHGNPSAVLRWVPIGHPEKAEAKAKLIGDEVEVEVSAFPVLPEDVRSILGVSVTGARTGTAGSVAVGVVKAVGPHAVGLSVNDAVLATCVVSGAWAKSVVTSSATTFKIPSSLRPEEAAMLPSVLTAYALLDRPYLGLVAGDVILQTCGETAVGAAVEALCRVRGFSLVSLPAAPDPRGDPKLQSVGKVKLAIAQSSGSAVLALSRTLQPRGEICCVLGPLEPLQAAQAAGGVTVPVSPLIFSGAAVRGFDFSLWAREKGGASLRAALGSLVSLDAAGKFSLRALRKDAKVFSAVEVGAAVEAAKSGIPVVVSLL